MSELESETFDYYQELARASFADMLLDEERNHKYAIGIKEAIEKVKSSGKKANVLDIGTGSGLLAMLAARYGADSVVTIEAYSPVFEIARKIITENGFKDKVKMINKHSSEVRVGAGKDMEQKANILVAELLDTELIGEAAILTYNEAHKNLTEADCICVPHSSDVYVQIVESELASSWYEFKELCLDEKIILKAPDSVNECQSNGTLNDIQLSQFPLKEFKAVSKPLKVCEFDFSKIIPESERKNIEFIAQEDAKSTITFFWWDLNMNESGSNKLSCAPHWSHPDTEALTANSKSEIVRQNAIPWRDHWMQACFRVNKALKKGEKYQLSAMHDKFSWNFDIFTEQSSSPHLPTCSCSFHRLSKNGILQINDENRRTGMVNFLRKHKEMECALFVGDHSLMSLVAAKMECAERIFVYQNEVFNVSLNSFIKENQLSEKIKVINSLDNIEISSISHLISDSSFSEAVEPLQSIAKFLQIAAKFNHAKIFPTEIKIYGVPVHFLNLHKIRWPLQSQVEGFDHKIFDSVLEVASNFADDNIEPFSLWEYPCYALGESTCVAQFNADGLKESKSSKITVDDFSKLCNGIAFWMEWKLDDDDMILSNGPSKSIKCGEMISWKFDRQTVHLIPYKHVMAGRLSSTEVKIIMEEGFEEIAMDFRYFYDEKRE